jgi:hypothetical protein
VLVAVSVSDSAKNDENFSSSPPALLAEPEETNILPSDPLLVSKSLPERTSNQKLYIIRKIGRRRASLMN